MHSLGDHEGIQELMQLPSEIFVVIIKLRSTRGSHAFVIDTNRQILFDRCDTQALRLCEETIQGCGGPGNFAAVTAYRLVTCRTQNTQKRKRGKPTEGSGARRKRRALLGDKNPGTDDGGYTNK